MSDAVCAPALRVTLPAVSDSLALLRHVMRGFRDAYVIGPATMDDIVLAVSEAATNVVVHAYGGRAGTLTVVGRMEDGRLHILVRDHGGALMNHVAATLEILGSAAGTDVLMTFDLTAEHDGPELTDLGAPP